MLSLLMKHVHEEEGGSDDIRMRRSKTITV